MGVALLGLNDVTVMCFIHPGSVYILLEGAQQCVFIKNMVQI